MANTFAPFGLLPFGQREGASPTAGLTRCFMASSDPNTCYTGDTVRTSSLVTASNRNYVTQDAGSSIAGQVRGVFAGCEYYSPTVGRQVWSSYFPGAVQTGGPDVIAYVIDDPNQLFIAQASTTSVVGSSNVNANIGVIFSTGTAATNISGRSGLSLSSSLVTASASLPFRIVDLYSNSAPPGVNGTSTDAGAVLIVAPNNWDRKQLTGSATQ